MTSPVVSKPVGADVTFNSRSFTCEEPSAVTMAARTVVPKATAPPGLMDPFPIAAVEFPAASRASVRSRTHSSSRDISAMPPAVSEIGPIASIECQ